ncbi:hypothetical protein C8J56DRAFT_935060 [Mycena floridula]|nr:hypothetical protein C8J56DRAFT_935060 [Mycena floridula]
MVKHLPLAVKQLLTLRNPYPLPGPSSQRLKSILKQTHQDAAARKAETGWLVLTACALLTSNRPSTIGEFYRFTTESSSNITDSVNKAALIREAFLKSTIFVGVPRVILSLQALNEALDNSVRSALRKDSRRFASPENIEETVTRGRALWDSIYAPHADKLHDKLGSYHPDFISFIIQSYGAVLSPLPGETRSYGSDHPSPDPDQGNLSRAMGSIVGIACLRAEERVVPQLTSHVFGLLKARDITDISPEDQWLSSDEGTEWVIRTVDDIVDVATADDLPQAKL